MQSGSPEAVLAAISQSTNELTQGWMRILASTPGAAEALSWLGGNGELQSRHLEKQTKLWNSLVSGNGEALIAPAPGDRRFAHRQWTDNPYYDYVKQSYLLAAEYLTQLVEQAALEPRAKERVRFAVKQWIDAMCPANFAATNPHALEQALASQGESLTRGLARLLADVQRGRISHTDEGVFEIGRNLAVTPGTVVYENELIQLIQYAATTKEVAQRPLVIVPPCINKYYVLDLQPGNSFVAHAVASGHIVFMVSWRNVGAAQGHLTWDDYLELGVFTPLRVASEIAGSDKVNALGFCVGGTLLGAALAVLAAKRKDIVSSATFLAAMLDFTETGQIGLFVDETSVAAREAAIGKGGILPGSDLAFVFSSLRANDLVWPYVVNNYLLGEVPAAFDILHWNADSTNLPGPMYCYYLRNTYLSNKLRDAGSARELRRPGRSPKGQPAELCARHPRGPYRSVALGLSHARASRRRGQDLYPRGERSYRRRGQSACEQAAQLLSGSSFPPHDPADGWKKPRNAKAAGGRCGATGSPGMPAVRARHLRRPEMSNTQPSKRRPAAM